MSHRPVEFTISAWMTIIMMMIMIMAGCAGLEKPYPAKQYFAIDAGDPATVETRNEGIVVRVLRLRITEPFARQSFVYRKSASEYETDYYHVFTADPAMLLTGETIQWLDATELFDAVIDTASSIDHQYLLESQATTLCGDFTTGQTPRAMIEAKFFLIDDRGAESVIKFQREYNETEELPQTDAQALAEGWGKCYGRILATLTDDLSKLEFEP